MKILLILVLSINTSWACGSMTVEQVNNCQVNDVYFELMKKVYPDFPIEMQQFAEGEIVPEGLTLWDQTLNKGALDYAQLEAELVKWKQKRIKKINHRNRVNNIKNLRRLAIKCGYDQPNMALLKKKIIDDIDEVKADCLESKKAEVEAEDLERKDKKDKFDTAKEYLKNYNCNILKTKFDKALCTFIKGRL